MSLPAFALAHTRCERPSTRLWRPGVLAITFGGILVIFSPAVADPDLWGHVRFGLDLWQTGQIVRPDTYSYLTAGWPWINHEWLAEAIYALLYRTFGPPGLIGLNLGLGLLIMALLCGALQRRGAGVVGASLLLTLAALTLRPNVLTVRPQVFTYLFFLLILLIASAAEQGRLRPLWAVAPIMALWANLHGGVLAGLGIFWLWGFLHLARAAWQARSLRGLVAPPQVAVWATLAASVLALLANPYGPRLVEFLLRTATVPRPEIAEWQPLNLASVLGRYYVAGLTLAALGLAGSRRPRSLPLLAVLLCTALLPWLSSRHTPFFALAAPAVAGEHIAAAARRIIPAKVAAWWTALARRRLPALLLLLCGVSLAAVQAQNLRRIEIWPRVADFPAAAVAVLRQSGVQGNLAVEFNWGEYVLWHLGPGVQVSVDGRRETVYPDAVYRENLAFMFGESGWQALLDRPATTMALVSRAHPAFELAQTAPGWELVYEDALCGIFARSGSRPAALIRGTPASNLPPDGAGLAFP